MEKRKRTGLGERRNAAEIVGGRGKEFVLPHWSIKKR